MENNLDQLSDQENIAWLLVSITVKCLIFFANFYFIKQTLKYVRAFGSSVDKYTLYTLLLLSLATSIRGVCLLIEDLVQLKMVLEYSNPSSSYMEWFNKNSELFINIVTKIRQGTTHLRNIAFFINISRWYLIIRQNQRQMNTGGDSLLQIEDPIED